MERRLDIESWRRRRHFEYFRTLDQPFFSLCAEVDVTDLLAGSRRAGGPSFFAAALYCAMRAINQTEPFRYRLDGDGVLVHETVHPGFTVLMPDDTFSFAYCDWDPDFDAFTRAVAAEVERIRSGSVALDPEDRRTDLIHGTSIPWVSFTAFSHARRTDPAGSIPKLVFGRYHRVEGRMRMPVSIEAHHALVDGIDAGRFFERMQEYLGREGSRLCEGGRT